jgi:hypothetical protein
MYRGEKKKLLTTSLISSGICRLEDEPHLKQIEFLAQWLLIIGYEKLYLRVFIELH